MTYKNIKGLFAGSGGDALNNESICQKVIQLAGKKPTDCNLVYIGTATYDHDAAMQKQTICFKNSGVNIISLQCAEKTPTENEIIELTQKADIILVSGGNTLYACDRWKQINLHTHLTEAAYRGCVLTGGSAGAICWFTGGHSDSMDPSSYRKDNIPSASESNYDEIFKKWSYIRVPCLNIFPGIVCPHYDKIQSNGILRAIDFDNMMKRHHNERGICIDHWASIVLFGDGTFEIFCPENTPGSVDIENNFDKNRNGKPGCWIKDVVDQCTVETKLIGTHGTRGKIDDLFRATIDNSDIIEDDKLTLARTLNPIPPK